MTRPTQQRRSIAASLPSARLAVLTLLGGALMAASQATMAQKTASSPATAALASSRASTTASGPIARYLDQTAKAKTMAAKADVASISLALDTFQLDCGRYPTAAEGLTALVNNAGGVAKWQGPYFENGKIPIDPWGKPYIYRCPGQHNPTGFDLSSCGPDGREGGGDDIDNWTQP